MNEYPPEFSKVVLLLSYYYIPVCLLPPSIPPTYPISLSHNPLLNKCP